jgi:hypothetical protein
MNPERIQIKKKINPPEDTEITKWTQRRYKHQKKTKEDIKKRGKWNKEGNTRCERGT